MIRMHSSTPTVFLIVLLLPFYSFCAYINREGNFQANFGTSSTDPVLQSEYASLVSIHTLSVISVNSLNDVIFLNVSGLPDNAHLRFTSSHIEPYTLSLPESPRTVMELSMGYIRCTFSIQACIADVCGPSVTARPGALRNLYTTKSPDYVTRPMPQAASPTFAFPSGDWAIESYVVLDFSQFSTDPISYGTMISVGKFSTDISSTLFLLCQTTQTGIISTYIEGNGQSTDTSAVTGMNHLILQKEGSNIMLYNNNNSGKLLLTSSTQPTPGTEVAMIFGTHFSTSGFSVSKGIHTGERYYHSRMYTKAMTAEERTAHYLSGPTLKPADILASSLFMEYQIDQSKDVRSVAEYVPYGECSTY